MPQDRIGVAERLAVAPRRRRSGRRRRAGIVRRQRFVHVAAVAVEIVGEDRGRLVGILSRIHRSGRRAKRPAAVVDLEEPMAVTAVPDDVVARRLARDRPFPAPRPLPATSGSRPWARAAEAISLPYRIPPRICMLDRPPSPYPSRRGSALTRRGATLSWGGCPRRTRTTAHRTHSSRTRSISAASSRRSRTRGSAEPCRFPISRTFTFPQPVDVALTIRRAAALSKWQEPSTGSPQGDCARCLEPVELPLHLEIDERVRSRRRARRSLRRGQRSPRRLARRRGPHSATYRFGASDRARVQRRLPGTVPGVWPQT